MAKILILYSTTDGHTRDICLRLQRIVECRNHRAALFPIADAASVDLKAFDKIVIGASIRYGRHSPDVYAFIKRNSRLLDTKPNAFFSVNLVARKPEKNRPETNPYLKKFLKRISWKPKKLAVFAGKLDYPKYRFLDRLMIRFIMWMTKGPTDPNTSFEFTDWNLVDNFGCIVCDM